MKKNWKKHWTQTPEGREKMREIALATNSIAKAREARVKKQVNIDAETLSLIIHGWQFTVSNNEIRIKR